MSCMPIAATRKFHNSAAGKSSGTSLIDGSSSCAAAMIAMNTAPLVIEAFHDPKRAPICRRRFSDSAIAASETTIMKKNRLVRSPIVSGTPTDGGLAGYLSAGTIVSAMNAAIASQADSARSLSLPTRPYAYANTSEQAAERSAIDHDTGEQAEARLRFATHKFSAGRFAFIRLGCLFKCDGLSQRRCASDFREAKREQPGSDAGQHPAQ